MIRLKIMQVENGFIVSDAPELGCVGKEYVFTDALSLGKWVTATCTPKLIKPKTDKQLGIRRS